MQALRGFVPLRGDQKAGNTMAGTGIPCSQKKTGVSAFTIARAGFPGWMGRFQSQRRNITCARNGQISLADIPGRVGRNRRGYRSQHSLQGDGPGNQGALRASIEYPCQVRTWRMDTWRFHRAGNWTETDRTFGLAPKDRLRSRPGKLPGMRPML